MALKLQDLIIDVQSMCAGDILLIGEAHPYYKYVEGVKTDNVAGISYPTLIPSLNYEKVPIKVEGELIPSVEYAGTPIKLAFDDLTGKAYQDFKTKEIKLSLSATSVKIADGKARIKINTEG